MRRIRLQAENWSCEPVMEAESFGDRLTGLRRLGPGESLIIRTSSVHALGMKRPFRAIGLSSDLVVIAHATVRPWRAIWFRRCSYVVELPLEVAPPPIGARMEIKGG